MELVLLKLVLTPTLIGAASLAGRRWGAFIGGWLIALPLTSGPVTFFLALDQGPGFAAGVAAGSLLGVMAIAAVAGAAATFAVVGAIAQPLVPLPVAVPLLLVVASLVAAARGLPQTARSEVV